ncbi:MAG: rhomboid family intramembrane serine protease [Saprospiraceae bacterium]|uniref:Rhomboid family intramembrane serine protease n=1 Tax=Candidatus Defluviibacterium haderslevense TaxID=2981993 RepID=A0A9D7XDN9_9BACT|nr:rhomboid family intramembrane serine protease [Candidatus Defluviibacterium haderslevense]MBK9716860.1 rhomboid family intramembrane serine protease [Candidatus Defluviibacterium haderslevense]MBL0236089.1 rhomboid family intramembrane serine protease [Candidatus Defluviibacterium haderslevense]MCC7026978.1 rhomboid family intramembrane serine protease [Saprospiraceae bacterium]
MFFPIGDDQVQGGAKPLFSYTLILINVLVFGYEIMLTPDQSEMMVTTYGAIPQEIIQGQDMYTLLSCMFLHGGWMHLIGNMLFLWVFADNIEAVVGTFNFMIFYIIGGVAASAIHIFFNPYSEVPMVGASGAISAVMGAYLIMFPSSRIKVLILIFFTTTYVPALFFLGIWIVQQLVAGVGSLNPTTAESAGVAWWAHIGGFIFGVVAGFIARKQYKDQYTYQEHE